MAQVTSERILEANKVPRSELRIWKFLQDFCYNSVVISTDSCSPPAMVRALLAFEFNNLFVLTFLTFNLLSERQEV